MRCLAGGPARGSRSVRSGRVAEWLSGKCVGGGEPAAELVVDVTDCGDADAMSEQRVELGRRLQPPGRWRCWHCWRQDQSEVDAAGGAGLDHRELLAARSEEHTSELQSQSNVVCRLLLEKKNTARAQT